MKDSKDVLDKHEKLRRAFLDKSLKLVTAVPAVGLLLSDLVKPAYAPPRTSAATTTNTPPPTTTPLTTPAPTTTLPVTAPGTTAPAAAVPAPSTVALIAAGIAAAGALSSRLRAEAEKEKPGDQANPDA